MSTPTSRITSRTDSLKSTAKPQTSIITVTPFQPAKPANYTPTHHVNNPPTSFTNPWPSSPPSHSLISILTARFFNSGERNFVPIPTDTSQLVPVRRADWGASNPDASSKLKATWIGHASFLAEFPSATPGGRGLRVALDPVFSSRMSPVNFLGPKRFTEPPCRLEELPEVDLVCISHNHYDHLDAATVRFVNERGKGRVRFLCGLGVGANLKGMGVREEDIVEMDWWDGIEVHVKEGDGTDVGTIKVICTPTQHFSGRGVTDHGATLWCSYAFEEVVADSSAPDEDSNVERVGRTGKKLFFAGDTAYRSVPKGTTDEQLVELPVCAAFGEIGKHCGPFDLALLPIGCYSPRWWMSAVHAAPEDSVCIHKDVRSRKSIGMHYGAIRGGISQYYEPVTDPPKRWKEACEKAGLKWEVEAGLCDIGETVVV